MANTIVSKLGDTPGISYTEIATKAKDCGRTELAIRVRMARDLPRCPV